MQYFRNIYEGIATAIVGMQITFKHLFAKKVTNQYPEIYHPIKSGDMPLNSRNRIFVEMGGCDGCNACARACPVNCIDVETVRVVGVDDDKIPLMNDGKKRRMWVTKHEIDFTKCCFCSLCTEACPTEAIVMTQEFEYSSFFKEDLVYNFSDLTAEEAAEKVRIFDEFQEQKKREQEEKKKADAAAKAKAAEASKSDGQVQPDAQATQTDEEKEAIKAQKRAEAEQRKAERLKQKNS